MANPRTINLPGSLADTQQYELAPGLAQYVQSVYVEIDNSGGADARPKLTLSEQSGVVIAKKRQGEAIAAGDTGSATWALRLTDEVTPTPSGIALPCERFACSSYSVANGHTIDDLPWSKFAGDTLVDLTDPHVPVFLYDGVYALSGWVRAFASPPSAATGTYTLTMLMNGSLDAGGSEHEQAITTVLWPGALTNSYTSMALTYRLAAGSILNMQVVNDLSAARLFGFVLQLQKLS